MKTGELIWLALRYAIQDRESIIDAYNQNEKEPAVQRAMKEIAQFRALQIRLFGTDKSKLDAMMSKLTPVNILRMMDGDK